MPPKPTIPRTFLDMSDSGRIILEVEIDLARGSVGRNDLLRRREHQRDRVFGDRKTIGFGVFTTGMPSTVA